MKKHYEKPLVAIEYYELTQTIASCSMKIGFLDSACVINDRDATNQMKNLAMQSYFTAGACTKDISNRDNADGICYHTSAGGAFIS